MFEPNSIVNPHFNVTLQSQCKHLYIDTARD